MAEEENWKLVTNMSLQAYACGAKASDRLILKKQIVCKDHRGNATGETYDPGGVWGVLTGNPDEPHVVWLRQPDGDYHTWDDASLFEWFAKAK